jgi:iron complex outermembrane recepter protein
MFRARTGSRPKARARNKKVFTAKRAVQVCAAATQTCVVLWALPAHAAAPAAPTPSTAAPSDAVVVTANPLASSLFDSATPTATSIGQGLFFRRSTSLGETLQDVPGVSSSYFGPASSRPVIRGMDGDRVRLLQNGGATLDASALSFDHAVPIDPLTTDKIEIVRGPAALFYGGSAIGGVVNVIDNRIAKSAVLGVEGEVEARLGGAERVSDGGARLRWGNSTVAFQVDAQSRRSNDLSIPGFARSGRQRALDAAAVAQPRNYLPNSDNHSQGLGLGASYTFADGYLGASWHALDMNYGSPAEAGVRIDLQNRRSELAGEIRNLGGFITALRGRVNQTDYRHHENTAGITGTLFATDGHEARVEATHRAIGPVTGSFGMQMGRSGFSALGAEAFVPTTKTTSRALFIFEEWQVFGGADGGLKLNGGGRHETTEISSAGGGPLDASTGATKFGSASGRQFSPKSYSVAGIYSFNRNWNLSLAHSSSSRAPTQGELFANGPHIATAAYEVGNRNFNLEKSSAQDLTLKFRTGAHSASVGVFRQKFRDFTTLFASGRTRGADGEINPVDADGNGNADGSGERILNELVYRAVRAEFRGFEAQGKMRVWDRVGTLDVELRADRVTATNRDTGTPLPRIAPSRLGVSLDYLFNRTTARLDITRVSAQNRVATGELPTDKYSLVNLTVSQQMPLLGSETEVFLRGTNLNNAEARLHTSFLKDRAPLGGRGIMAGLKSTF